MERQMFIRVLTVFQAFMMGKVVRLHKRVR